MATKIKHINVKDLDFNDVDLISEFPNQNLLLLLYNNQCLGCTGRAIPFAFELQQKHSNIKVIGIHSNFGNKTMDKSDIMSIFTTKTLPFPIYLDEDHSVYDYFKSEGTPQWIILTKTGDVYRSIFGSQGNAQNRLLYALESLD